MLVLIIKQLAAIPFTVLQNLLILPGFSIILVKGNSAYRNPTITKFTADTPHQAVKITPRRQSRIFCVIF
jgi:hypothetical protein